MWSSNWEIATIDIDRATEFSGDDVDRYSSLVDLKENYEFATVVIPALGVDGCVIGVSVQRDGEIDTVPSPVYIMDDDATGCFFHATTSASTAMTIVFRIGGIRWLRVKADTNQASDKTFYCRGFNRVTTG